MSTCRTAFKIALIVAGGAQWPAASSWGGSAAHAPRPSDDPGHSPNYADRLLSPYEGVSTPPRLYAARTRFPIHVTVLDGGGLFQNRWYDDAVSACSAWSAATSGVPGGGLRFVYSHGGSPEGADVVIRLVSRAASPDFRGMTVENDGWALMTVVVEAKGGTPPTDDSVRLIIMHEMGHALGIWGHSPDPNDIMSAKPNAARISLADVNTLRIAYGI